MAVGNLPVAQSQDLARRSVQAPHVRLRHNHKAVVRIVAALDHQAAHIHRLREAAVVHPCQVVADPCPEAVVHLAQVADHARRVHQDANLKVQLFS